jgi:DNA replication and repair protein RecF
LVWVERLRVRDLRNIREASFELGPGLNVFVGKNGQGKTTLLEAVGLVSRGRSFRTEDTSSMIRRGAASLLAGAAAATDGREAALEVELEPGRRAFRVNGREVRAGEYQGRLDVVVYSSERLRVIYGSMRDRRQFLDRQAAALWPAYRAELRQFERVLTQRNAALEARARDEDAWSERFVAHGARLRTRRAEYAGRLSAALAAGFRPAQECYAVRVQPAPASLAEAERELAEELRLLQPRERAAGRSLAGPQRDAIRMLIDGHDAGESASSGQARSLLLALALASLTLLREETGRPAIALLDDLDSELDEERAGALCAEVARRGQAWVTTAHTGWADSLRGLGRIYEVSQGAVRCASSA